MIKRYLRLAGGLVLAPLFIALYLYDRIICVPLVWIKHDNLMVWFRDNTKMAHSLIRAGAVGFILFLVWLFA
jgi:hypothetical protein